ncbi:tetratricopeptide repeat protein [Klebsiella pneumoniae]|uniref:transglutaminase family protein n=1 Tax=Klebsiella pneumoniae TaxID=573 RepID=UPI000E2AAD9E|nr:tetratricopeptide repeat protein [Klebsiella pneumoniae]HDS4788230.1 tetratricopeptide repeat protein [Klebsiella pneumoniae subsp. pneumoniae]EKX2834330.1 tetratricopeptide repeat protein [Klebsiella pneumoniae]SWU20414.1 protein SirB1 [Klebsiella pneumoniae]HBR3208730.1 tetratricopeptide repeat protein [Klebsiella pneumoniae]HBR7590018.1 tetratricopeptide repeat protein [Klebsiella pneumoniae]
MGSLADFEFNKAPLCDGMVLISEQVRDDFPSRFVEEELQRLLRLAQEEIAPSWDQERQIERLLELFYDEWGFGASQGVYRLSDALWLDKVLVNRQGSAVSLGAILLWIAQRLALPVVPVIFPTQMLLRADPETSEALLQFNPEDPYEIRDRGLIYAQLDCDHVALLDLSYFVEQCPEDPISEMIRAQINTISHKQITLH